MPVIHIVLFEWKPAASPEQISEVQSVLSCNDRMADSIQACTRMLGLKDNCIHPTSQKPYIKSFSGGKNTSPEGKSVSPCLKIPSLCLGC